jgi:hypothetical protein
LSHPTRIYHSLVELLAECAYETQQSIRFWTIRWNRWRIKHPGLPYMRKCDICSGAEHKWEIKTGRWKVKKPRHEVHSEDS